MNRRTRLILFVMVAAGLAWFGIRSGHRPGISPSAMPSATIPAGVEVVQLPCYFPARTGLDPVEELRRRPKVATALERLRGAMEELHRGPASPGALPIFPPGLQPRGVFLTPEGIAYLDEPAVAWDHPVGLREEILAVRAIARTILKACQEVHALVFMADGLARPRLMGHLVANGRYLLPKPASPRSK